MGSLILGQGDGVEEPEADRLGQYAVQEGSYRRLVLAPDRTVRTVDPSRSPTPASCSSGYGSRAAPNLRAVSEPGSATAWPARASRAEARQHRRDGSRRHGAIALPSPTSTNASCKVSAHLLRAQRGAARQRSSWRRCSLRTGVVTKRFRPSMLARARNAAPEPRVATDLLVPEAGGRYSIGRDTDHLPRLPPS